MQGNGSPRMILQWKFIEFYIEDGAFMETKLYKNALDNHQSLLIARVWNMAKTKPGSKGKIEDCF